MVNFHKQRTITPKRIVRYRPLSNLKKDIIVLTIVTKFRIIQIKTIQHREQKLFQMVNFHKQRVITPEGIMRYGPLSNLTDTLWYRIL